MSNEIIPITIALASAYVLGSLPAAYLIGRFRKGIDIRQIGTRNMGAMNVIYHIGFAEGMLVLAVDIGKGAAAVALSRFLGTEVYIQLLAGIIVVLGHSFPVFLRFRGGRGGATCIGVLLFLMPWGIPIYLALFGSMLLVTRFPTLSYSIAFICFPFLGWLVYHKWEFIVFPIVILLLPGIKYIPRIIEMRAKGGSWHHFFFRRGLKDRF